MELPIPPTPNFSDKVDTPISELELEMKRAIAKRNYDIENINNQLLHKPNSQNQHIQNNFQSQKSNIKYIKIDNEEIHFDLYKNQVIDLNIQDNKKHVHWSNEQDIPVYSNTTNITNTTTDNTTINTNDNIFSKLKLIEPNYMIEIQSLQEEVKQLRIFIEEQMEDIKNQILLII